VNGHVRTDGKHFSCGGERFAFRGVTYGTFQPRHDAARYPDRDDAKRDFAAMREAGFTVARTYTPPPDDVVDIAADWGIRMLTDVFYPDWRYLVGTSRRQRRRMVREATAKVRSAAHRYAGNPGILALSLGNEIPADVVRWFGTAAVVEVIEELAEVVREEDPDRLVTYANYPTTEFLPLECLDFLTLNVFLEQHAQFRKYLTRLHHLAGDRPLVLGEMGIDAGDDSRGEARQAAVIDWQLETALERGVAGTCLFSWTDEWWVGDAAVRPHGIPARACSPEPRYCGDFYGQTGKGEPCPEGITVDALVRIIAELPAGVTELSCHPGEGDDFDSVYRSERAEEIAVLCDPRVRAALAEHRVRLSRHPR